MSKSIVSIATAVVHASLALSISCSGGSNESSVEVDDLCAENGGAFVGFVDKLVECTPEFELFLGEIPAAAEVSAACNAQFEGFIDDGTVTFGEKSQLEACIAAIANADCETFEIDNLEECENITIGQVEDGGDCESSDQCAGEAYCEQASDAADCGTCAPKLADGISCEENNDCASGKCRANGACGSFAAEGDSCDEDDDCVGRLICRGTCEVQGEAAVGDACTEFTQCGFPLSNMFCNEEASECEEFLALGDDCFDGAAALGTCNLIEYQSCDFADTRKCIGATIVGLGDDCGFGQGLRCDEGLVCSGNEGGTCVELGLGAACDSSAEGNTCGLFLECKDDDVCGYETEYTGMCPAEL